MKRNEKGESKKHITVIRDPKFDYSYVKKNAAGEEIKVDPFARYEEALNNPIVMKSLPEIPPEIEANRVPTTPYHDPIPSLPYSQLTPDPSAPYANEPKQKWPMTIEPVVEEMQE